MMSEENESKSFAELVESYSGDGEEGELQVGDKVTGEIISIGADTVFVNTGTKIDGSVEKSELVDENGELPLSVGDTVELYVVAAEENEIRLSRAISGVGGLNMLQEAHETGTPVEGKVKAPCKGGFHIDLLGRRAFCPISQIDIRYVETPEEYTGQVFEFLITRFEEDGRNIVVSRSTLLKKEQEKAQKEFMEEKLSAGAQLEGRVMRLVPYGAFVELFPGIEGMIHVSEVSWSRVEHPQDVLSPGQTVTVKVLDIKPRERIEETRISLSIKAVERDPWESIEENFSAGQKVRGKVTRCADFGAFVEIAPGIEGLVHISEMSYTRRIVKPQDVVKEGQETDVLIKEIDTDRKRVSLSIRDAEGDPWIGMKEKYAIGGTITGTVEKWERFGCFVTLEPGITGLLPKSKISKSPLAGSIEKLKVGEPITIVVEEIDTEARKITLAPTDKGDEGDWRKYVKPEKPKAASASPSPSSSSLGTLGEKLQQAMNEKKRKQ